MSLEVKDRVRHIEVTVDAAQLPNKGHCESCLV